jgi:hypothetical protein
MGAGEPRSPSQEPLTGAGSMPGSSLRFSPCTLNSQRNVSELLPGCTRAEPEPQRSCLVVISDLDVRSNRGSRDALLRAHNTTRALGQEIRPGQNKPAGEIILSGRFESRLVLAGYRRRQDFTGRLDRTPRTSLNANLLSGEAMKSAS